MRLAPIAGFESYLQPVIADGKVRYVGEPVAVVVADSRALAEDALGGNRRRLSSRCRRSADWRTSEADKALLFEQNGTNVAARYTRRLRRYRRGLRRAPSTPAREIFRATAIPPCRWRRAA